MKRTVSIITALLLVISTISCGTQETYTVTEAYQYPVQPWTEVWDKLDGIEERVKACKVPAKTMKKMTTEALAETVMTYPLLDLISVYTLESSNYGLDSGNREEIRRNTFIKFAGDFDGIEILKKRPDAVEKLKNYQEKHKNETGKSLKYADEIILYITQEQGS